MKFYKYTTKYLLHVLIAIILLIPISSFAQGAGMINMTPTDAASNVNNSKVINAKDSDVSSPSLMSQIWEEKGKYVFIAPFGPFTNLTGDTLDLTNPSFLGRYIKIWFNFLIGIGAIIGVVRLVTTGFKIIMESDNIDALKAAKGEIKNIVMALGLVAVSWVILNSLNPDLVNKNLILPVTTSSSTVKTTSDYSNEGTYLTPEESLLTGVSKPGYYYIIFNTKTGVKEKRFGSKNNYEECIKIAKKDESLNKSGDIQVLSNKCYEHFGASYSEKERANRELMARMNVYANSTNAKKTRMEGLSQAILTKIGFLAKDLRQTNCSAQDAAGYGTNCPVVISGGTEDGHQTHGMNAPYTLDLRKTGALVDFLDKNALYKANTFVTGKYRYKYDGIWYTDEDESHFHACDYHDPNWYCQDKNKNGKPYSNCKPTGREVKGGSQQLCTN